MPEASYSSSLPVRRAISPRSTNSVSGPAQSNAQPAVSPPLQAVNHSPHVPGRRGKVLGTEATWVRLKGGLAFLNCSG